MVFNLLFLKSNQIKKDESKRKNSVVKKQAALFRLVGEKKRNQGPLSPWGSES
jgi:hypothetical protein